MFVIFCNMLLFAVCIWRYWWFGVVLEEIPSEFSISCSLRWLIIWGELWGEMLYGFVGFGVWWWVVVVLYGLVMMWLVCFFFYLLRFRFILFKVGLIRYNLEFFIVICLDFFFFYLWCVYIWFDFVVINIFVTRKREEIQHTGWFAGIRGLWFAVIWCLFLSVLFCLDMF